MEKALIFLLIIIIMSYLIFQFYKRVVNKHSELDLSRYYSLENSNSLTVIFNKTGNELSFTLFGLSNRSQGKDLYLDLYAFILDNKKIYIDFSKNRVTNQFLLGILDSYVQDKRDLKQIDKVFDIKQNSIKRRLIKLANNYGT